MFGRRRLRHITVFDHRPMTAVARHQRPATIRKNPEQPGVEPRVLAEARETVVHAHERVLHRLFCILFTAQHVAREAQASGIVELHDLDERLLIAVLGTDWECRVEVAHGRSKDCKGAKHDTP